MGWPRRPGDGLGAWQDAHIEAEDFRELSGERVLVLSRFIGRGKSSGIEIGQIRATGASVFELQEAKVTRHAFYFDRYRALADLGLKQ
jgi:hypothetical protein